MSEILNPLMGTSRVLVGQVAWAAVTGGLFIGVLWLAFRSLRLLSPGVKATLWWLACLKLVVGLVWFAPVPLPVLPAPVTPSVNQQSVVQQAPEPPVAFVAESTPATVVQSQHREVPAAPAENVDTVGALILAAAFVWFVGLMLSFGMLLRRARQQASILRMSKPLADEPTERAVATIAARLGLRRPPVVRMADDIDSPFVTGLTRPTLLLPTGLWPRLTDAERDIAICHECVHLHRGDLLLRWIPILAERLFFFLPLARLAAREYVLCNEAACDARVLQVLPATPREYGNVLLALGASSHHAAVLAVGSSSFAVLKRRIAMLAVPSQSSVASRTLAVASVVLAIVVLAPVRPVARSTSSSSPTPSVVTALTSSSQTVVGEPDANNSALVTAGDQQAGAGTSSRTSAASVPKDKAIQDAKARIAALHATEADLARRFGPDYPTKATLIGQIVQAERDLQALLGNGGAKVAREDQQANGDTSARTTTEQPDLQKAIQNAETILRMLRAQDAELAGKYGEKHPERVSVAFQIQDAERMLRVFQGNGTPTEQRAIGAMMQRAEKRLTFLQSTGDERAKLEAEARGRAVETLKRMEEPPVIDPDAPTVTVVEFDKTATYDQPMHFRVIVTGSVPVPRLSVALRRIETPETRAFFLSSPTSGSNSSSKVADARTLTDFTIIPKCKGNCDISVRVTDEQGRSARWIAGTVVVKPQDIRPLPTAPLPTPPPQAFQKLRSNTVERTDGGSMVMKGDVRLDIDETTIVRADEAEYRLDRDGGYQVLLAGTVLLSLAERPSIRAKYARHIAEDGTAYRSDVRIPVGSNGARMLADECDAFPSRGEFRLRGNVRIERNYHPLAR